MDLLMGISLGRKGQFTQGFFSLKEDMCVHVPKCAGDQLYWRKIFCDN